VNVFITLILITGSPGVGFNNDVKCTTPGWRTYYNPGASPATDSYFDAQYKLATPTSIASGFLITLSTTGSKYCNVPTNEFVLPQKPCGNGDWDSLNSVCICSIVSTEVNNLGQSIQIYQLQSPVPYCARSCLALKSTLANSATPNDWNNQICGGNKRGSCISDGIGGTRCKCNNGYSGLVCQTSVCPRARGKICGGSGLCDHANW